MSDQVHANGILSARTQRLQVRCLGTKLLHAILTKQCQPERSRLGDRLGGIRLRDGHQLHVFAAPSCTPASIRDRRLQLLEILPDWRHLIEEHPSGAKTLVDLCLLTYGLKPARYLSVCARRKGLQTSSSRN